MTPELFETHDWYDTPFLYDTVFAGGTDDEANFLQQVASRFGPARGRRVLEPACGSGRLLEAMAARGFHVTGFDQNPAMVAYSQARLQAYKPRARVSTGDMAQFAYNTKFHLAHCLVSTFKYLMTEAAARSHLECVSAALVPGGIYVLGFHLTEYAYPRRMRERWFGKASGTDVICNIQTWPAQRKIRQEKVRSRLTVCRGRKRRSLQTEWQFRTYDAAQAKRLLKSVPSLELVQTYDFGYDFSQPRQLDDSQLDCVLVLRRRPDGAV
jgi:SAM-dependent methyltransferase